MLRLLHNQKPNRKNNHYLAYFVSNIVRRNGILKLIMIITFLIVAFLKVDFPMSQITVPKALPQTFSKHTLLVITAQKPL